MKLCSPLHPMPRCAIRSPKLRPSPCPTHRARPGALKGAPLPHRSRAITFLAMAAEYRCFGVDDHFLALAPMCHGAGFVFACATLFFGGTTSLFAAGDPVAVLDRIGEGDITGVFMVPTQFARMFDLSDSGPRFAPQTPIDQHHIKRRRAAPIHEGTCNCAFRDGLLHETYGSTEGGIVTNIRPSDLKRKPGSVGLPFPGVEIELAPS